MEETNVIKDKNTAAENEEDIPSSGSEQGKLFPALPITLPADAVGGAQRGTDGEAARTRRGRILKALSAALCFVFCGTSLTFMAAQSISVADKLSTKPIGELLMSEVYGGAAAPRDEEEQADAPQRETGETAPQEGVTDALQENGQETGAPDGEEDAPDAVSYPVSRTTLSNYDLLTSLSNETSYEPDLASLLNDRCGVGKMGEIKERYGDGAPAVLIVHTHGTEAYIPEGSASYTTDEPFRSTDTDLNVIAVGDVMAKVLESEGIGVIHCTEMFDKESYRESYSKSREAVARYLSEYPSISYVFDVHRDSVITEDMTCIATLAECAGNETAQSMIVVGTDEGGADHDTWEMNLSLALNIQKNMADECATLPRRINLRSAAFNQGLCSGSLLFEIGSCGNSLREAKCAGVLTALAAASAINGAPCGIGAEEALNIFVP